MNRPIALGAAVVVLVAAAPVAAQTIIVPPSVSAADVQAAILAAAPPPCNAPLPDTLNGAAGSGTTCMRKTDETRPTAVQMANVTLGADCTWAVAWARSFTSTTPGVHAEVVLPAGATQPISCQPTARSPTGASGKCFAAQTQTLAAVTVVGVSVAVGGQTVTPFNGSTCTAGLPVMVYGRDSTQ